MVKLLFELLEFLRSSAPLLTSLAVLTLLCVLLSKSIKRHAMAYYIALAIPFLLVALPSLAKLFGFEIMSFVRVPFLGEIVRDYIHMGTFGHPILIIIMYMGALKVKNRGVKRLLNIRKELSIIVGFPVLAHSLIRVMNNLPGAITFFADRDEYLATKDVASELGAGVSSFSFILGVIMLVIFIPLWVTSFDWVRKHMTYKKWKSFQKLAYVLYATLFIHAMGIQIGGLLNPRGGHAAKPAVETVIQQQGNHGGMNERGGEQGGKKAVKAADSNRRTPSKGFADYKISTQTKGYIHIISLILIYGSYLYLRLRKAKRSREKRKAISVA